MTMQVRQTQSLMASGRKTDTDTTDRTISVNDMFGYISLYNEGTTELTVAIDESSLTASKPIYIPASTGWDGYIQGKTIHYTGTAGSTNFRFSILG